MAVSPKMPQQPTISFGQIRECFVLPRSHTEVSVVVGMTPDNKSTSISASKYR